MLCNFIRLSIFYYLLGLLLDSLHFLLLFLGYFQIIFLGYFQMGYFQIIFFKWYMRKLILCAVIVIGQKIE